MPSSQDALLKLRDLKLPDPISWWPLALGFELLIVLALALIGGGIFYGRRVYSRGKARREALRLLSNYETQYQQGASSQEISACLSELLRRVALLYYPREIVAGLQGEAWLAFLNQTGAGIDFNAVKNALVVHPYQANQTVDLMPLFSCAKRWIILRRRRGDV